MLLIRKKRKPRVEPPPLPEPVIPEPEALDPWSDVTLPSLPTRRPRRAVIARDRAARLWEALKKR